MHSGSFELSIVGGVEDSAAGTVTLPHLGTFKVALTNCLAGRRCNVRLVFNGQPAGEYRVHGGQTAVLKRPASQEAPWTFLEVGTPEASAAGLPLDGNAGVLEAHFLPETLRKDTLLQADDALALEPDVQAASTEGDLAADAPVQGAGTDGSFQEADDIFTFDPAAAVRLALRLEGEPDATSNGSEEAPGVGWIQRRVHRLGHQLRKAEDGEDYLCPEHFRSLRGWVDAKIDLRLAERDQALSLATYEPVSCVMFACPDCQQDAKVPAGVGHVRVRCPHCSCQFVRQA